MAQIHCFFRSLIQISCLVIPLLAGCAEDGDDASPTPGTQLPLEQNQRHHTRVSLPSEGLESVFGWQDIPPVLPSPSPDPESVFGWQDIPPIIPSFPPPDPESVFGWQDIPPIAPEPDQDHTCSTTACSCRTVADTNTAE